MLLQVSKPCSICNSSKLMRVYAVPLLASRRSPRAPNGVVSHEHALTHVGRRSDIVIYEIRCIELLVGLTNSHTSTALGIARNDGRGIVPRQCYEHDTDTIRSMYDANCTGQPSALSNGSQESRCSTPLLLFTWAYVNAGIAVERSPRS